MHHTDWTTTGALGDRYVLRTRVGSGRTTTVYAADDVRLEREVAVKVFHAVPDQDGLTRFATEAQVLGELSHPGLVTVYDVNLDAQTPYMVMRLIDGCPLSDLVQPEGLEPRAVARLGAQLAEVLAYVHERGVVHGDVDAHNVLIDVDSDGHLTGFGADYGLGTMSGDVYSLGMMLAECLPFGLGGEWRVVLASMTDPDPDARPGAYRAAEMLRNIVAGDTAEFPLPLQRSEEVAVEPPPRKTPREPRERKEPAARNLRPAYAGLTGMGLAISALAVVLATTSPEQPAQPAGEQPPKAEQPTDRKAPQPPGQSYPQAPGQLQADPPKSATSRKNQPKPTRPPQSSQPPRPPQQGDGPGDGGPGNGRGPGNGDGNGNDRNDRDGGLLGDLLGL